jgi:hypothetical protein
LARCIVTLAHVAGATQTIRLGTAVVVAAYFAPAIAAPDVDPDRSLATGLTVLEALAPIN